MQTDAFYGYGSALALLFLGLGLIASFFHLGRPERAWRSATQWPSCSCTASRTSLAIARKW
jgi:DMSO reductase anchor subunit